jgi:hypothetical protein
LQPIEDGDCHNQCDSAIGRPQLDSRIDKLLSVPHDASASPATEVILVVGEPTLQKKGGIMKALIAALFLPLIVLNFAGGLAGAVWLAFLGNWPELGLALLAVACVACCGVFACTLLLMPSLLFAVPAARLYEKGGVPRLASFPLMLAGALWTHAIMCGWALGWFAFYVASSGTASILPMVLIAFPIAAMPWAHMAEKQSQAGDERAWPAVFFLDVASAVFVVLVGIFGASLLIADATFIAIMTIPFILGFATKLAPTRPRQLA